VDNPVTLIHMFYEKCVIFLQDFIRYEKIIQVCFINNMVQSRFVTEIQGVQLLIKKL